tara:strand:- start:69 stop:290 length:222 start_codon:yes stop_codon:yes gene_type:complete
MITFMKVVGVFALFHSITSVILLMYFKYPIDLFMFFIFATEFAIGIMMFIGIKSIRDAEYHYNYHIGNKNGKK